MENFWMYHDDEPFGKIFGCPDDHLKDFRQNMAQLGWVDTPAKLIVDWHYTGGDVPVEKVKKKGPYKPRKKK